MTLAWRQVPAHGYPRRAYDEIRAWVERLADRRCFCPADANQPVDHSLNVSAYISDAGTEAGDPAPEGMVFRLAPDRTAGKPVHQRVADRVGEVYGKELYRYCHMGKEYSVYANALYACMTHFTPDFRGLLDNAPVFDSKRHLEKLGLAHVLPGLGAAGVRAEVDAYVKPFVWKEQNNPRSEGLGVNMWALLTMASLIGSSNLHPMASSDFARNVVSLVLQHAPRCATPGNKIPVRSYNVQTGHQELISVPAAARPDFFVRPDFDESFVQTGLMTYCRADPLTGLLPEDTLHCSQLERCGVLLACEPWSVPASFVEGSYSLMPGYPYALYRAPRAGGGGEEFGVVTVVGAEVRIMVRTDADETVAVVDSSKDWMARLASLDVIVLPMLIRPCAAVWDAGRGAVGVVVPAGQAEAGLADSNFDPDTLRYSVVFEEGEVAHVGPVEILPRLAHIGVALWLRPHSPPWESLRPAFPHYVQPADVDHTAVRVRLNVPSVPSPDPSKLYVSVIHRPVHSPNATMFTARTLEVDPWDLMKAGTPGFKELPDVLLV